MTGAIVSKQETCLSFGYLQRPCICSTGKMQFRRYGKWSPLGRSRAEPWWRQSPDTEVRHCRDAYDLTMAKEHQMLLRYDLGQAFKTLSHQKAGWMRHDKFTLSTKKGKLGEECGPDILVLHLQHFFVVVVIEGHVEMGVDPSLMPSSAWLSVDIRKLRGKRSAVPAVDGRDLFTCISLTQYLGFIRFLSISSQCRCINQGPFLPTFTNTCIKISDLGRKRVQWLWKGSCCLREPHILVS